MTQAVVQAVAVIYLIYAVFQAVENFILDSESIRAVAYSILGSGSGLSSRTFYT